MKRSAFFRCGAAGALAVAARPGASSAQPIAPAATPIKGDLIRFGDLFHIDYYTVRINAIAWLPSSDAVAKAIQARFNQTYLDDDSKGYLEIDADVKNASSAAANVPSPSFQVLFKDGSQTEDAEAIIFRGAQIFGTTQYQPGAGTSLRYIIANVAKPAGDLTVTKIIVKTTYDKNDAGAPPAFRLLSPAVTLPS